MKIAKNVFLWAVLLFAVSQVAFAQRQAPQQAPHSKGGMTREHRQDLSPEQRAANMTERMTKHLQLNEQQAAKVAEMNRKTAAQMSDIRQNEQWSRYEKFTKMQAIEQQRSAELRQFLTAEQYKKWEATKEKKEEQWQGHREQRLQNAKPVEQRAAQRTTRMTKNLNLNDKQVALVKDINLRQAKAIDDIQRSASLSKGDRLRQLDEQARSYDSELKKILSPEQQQKAELMRLEMKEKRHRQKGK